MSDIIRLEHIDKTYNLNKPNEFKALYEVSLNIARGEMVSICGTSGAGKTTLLNIIGLADSPSNGLYYLDGISVENYNDKQRAALRNKCFGYVLQDYGLLAEETVYENVIIPLVFSKTKQREYKIKAESALKLIGISELKNKRISELSGGQKQRVAIARAIVNDPDILLADEPTGALDSETGKEIIECFKSICKRGKTVLIITHDMNIAKTCDRIIEISDGRIVAVN